MEFLINVGLLILMCVVFVSTYLTLNWIENTFSQRIAVIVAVICTISSIAVLTTIGV